MGIEVASVDINRAALTAGSALMRAPIETTDAENSPMDALPFADGSKDTAVLSLALDLTAHTRNPKRRNDERIEVLSELNRVVKEGGHAVLTFHERLFPDEAAFYRFVATVEGSFGFRRAADLTGRVSAYNEAEKAGYAVWLATFEKVAPAAPDPKSAALWEGLRFPRRRSHDAPERPRHEHSIAEEASGAFQDRFSIGETCLAYTPASGHQQALEEMRVADEAEKRRVNERIDALIDEYGSIAQVPEHLFLAISLEDVSKGSRAEKDRYFEALIERYGSVSRIPFDDLAKNGAVIIEHGTSKRRGSYICLAPVRKQGKGSGGFNTRYFFTDSPETAPTRPGDGAESESQF